MHVAAITLVAKYSHRCSNTNKRMTVTVCVQTPVCLSVCTPAVSRLLAVKQDLVKRGCDATCLHLAVPLLVYHAGRKSHMMTRNRFNQTGGIAKSNKYIFFPISTFIFPYCAIVKVATVHMF